MLAALGADILALYNLFPRNQADKLYNAFIHFLGDIEGEFGEVSRKAVRDYYSVAAEAVGKKENPFEFVVSLLCDRLDVPESESDPIIMSGLMYAVSQLVGKWKWIKGSFTVVA